MLLSIQLPKVTYNYEKCNKVEICNTTNDSNRRM